MLRTAVIDVVGLTDRLIGAQTPRIDAFRRKSSFSRIRPAFPAVTCTAQSTYLTGKPASAHGIVGNGWYDRDLAEVHFWKQSNHLVRGPKLWEQLRARDPRFTCAKLFWWFNMYASADYSITPRPMYPADGRKVFDIYTWPFSIRGDIQRDLGPFPFPAFWGPAAGRNTPQGAADAVSCWIADSAKWIERAYHPTLTLVYLPHLDYNLQRHPPWLSAPGGALELNPQIFPDLAAIDQTVGSLLDFYGTQGVQVILLSEYGLVPVDRPLHLNRLFRERGWLVVKEELGLELLDCGASQVFAVADHQVAHIYVRQPGLLEPVRELVRAVAGVRTVLGPEEQADIGIAHSRAGDLVAVADDRSWFTYYFWLDDARAPDFARTVDIHRKPGYDPAELFLDPGLRFPRLRIANRLLRKKLGFRMLMDVIPLDATLVRGSHGAVPAAKADYPVLIGPPGENSPTPEIEAVDVFSVLGEHVAPEAWA